MARVKPPPLAKIPTDFGYTEEHGLLASNARRFLSKHWDADRLRRFVDGALRGAAVEEVAPLDEAMTELGWFDMVLPPEQGGGGLGWLHAALLAEELGRALCPIRWAPRLLAAWVTNNGEGRGAIAFDADGATADDRVLRGRHRHVPGAERADYLVAPAKGDGHAVWLRIDLDAPGVERAPHRVQDATRACADVTYRDVEAIRPLDLADHGRTPQALELRAWLLHAAEGVGAAETVLGLTRDYAVERQQFGRPIGTFQAVSHPIVDSMIAVERARNLVYAVAAACDADASAQSVAPLARMAKVAADDALWDGASRGVQLHGGFGFTWDCNVHFYLRRAMSAQAELGSPAEHREALASMLLER
jgi:alkylation response protein AidB-like acyl-CoA dehydrogenase